MKKAANRDEAEAFLMDLAEKPALIAIDLGAGSGRVSLLRWLPSGPIFHVIHRFDNHPVIDSSSLRWDLTKIQDEVSYGIRSCARLAPEGVASIAIDGWSVDYVRLSTEGIALEPPFCYRDRRTEESSEMIFKAISPDVLEDLTGLPPMNILTINQFQADILAGLRINATIEPAWLQLPEYLLSRLGAQPVAEISNASHTGLMERRTQTWSDQLLWLLDIPLSAAPRIVASGTPVGFLNNELALLRGLGRTRLVAPACHDTASAIATVPCSDSPEAYVSIGTWLLVGAAFSMKRFAEGTPKGFLCLRGVGDIFCVHKAFNGMWLISECLADWAEQGCALTMNDLRDGMQVPAPSFVFDVDDPELLRPGKMPEKINKSLSRRRLPSISTRPEGAAQVYQLILMSLAWKVAVVLKDLGVLTDVSFSRVHLLGGGIRHKNLLDFVARQTELEVICGSVEASTLGNLAVQADLQERHWDGHSPNRKDVSLWASKIRQIAPPSRLAVETLLS